MYSTCSTNKLFSCRASPRGLPETAPGGRRGLWGVGGLRDPQEAAGGPVGRAVLPCQSRACGSGGGGIVQPFNADTDFGWFNVVLLI